MGLLPPSASSARKVGSRHLLSSLLLEEFLEPKGVTQAAFAEKIGWTKTRLNELIKGKRGITAAAALDLADALGTSPKLWMNLQATFDLDKESKARRVA